jgi:hypothetical protein
MATELNKRSCRCESPSPSGAHCAPPGLELSSPPGARCAPPKLELSSLPGARSAPASLRLSAIEGIGQLPSAPTNPTVPPHMPPSPEPGAAKCPSSEAESTGHVFPVSREASVALHKSDSPAPRAAPSAPAKSQAQEDKTLVCPSSLPADSGLTSQTGGVVSPCAEQVAISSQAGSEVKITAHTCGTVPADSGSTPPKSQRPSSCPTPSGRILQECSQSTPYSFAGRMSSRMR